jgi:hypothetical protein
MLQKKVEKLFLMNSQKVAVRTAGKGRIKRHFYRQSAARLLFSIRVLR